MREGDVVPEGDVPEGGAPEGEAPSGCSGGDRRSAQQSEPEGLVSDRYDTTAGDHAPLGRGLQRSTSK